MKRAFAALVLALACVSHVAVAAPGSFTVAGHVSTGNPMTKRLSGFTERSNPCGRPDPQFGSTNGLDGYWIALPPDAAGQRATLTSDAVDMDVWFYSDVDGCALIDGNEDAGWISMVTDLTPDEEGLVPAGATLAIVDLAAGADADFVFRLG